VDTLTPASCIRLFLLPALLRTSSARCARLTALFLHSPALIFLFSRATARTAHASARTSFALHCCRTSSPHLRYRHIYVCALAPHHLRHLRTPAHLCTARLRTICASYQTCAQSHAPLCAAHILTHCCASLLRYHQLLSFFCVLRCLRTPQVFHCAYLSARDGWTSCASPSFALFSLHLRCSLRAAHSALFPRISFARIFSDCAVSARRTLSHKRIINSIRTKASSMAWQHQRIKQHIDLAWRISHCKLHTSSPQAPLTPHRTPSSAPLMGLSLLPLCRPQRTAPAPALSCTGCTAACCCLTAPASTFPFSLLRTSRTLHLSLTLQTSLCWCALCSCSYLGI